MGSLNLYQQYVKNHLIAEKIRITADSERSAQKITGITASESGHFRPVRHRRFCPCGNADGAGCFQKEEGTALPYYESACLKAILDSACDTPDIFIKQLLKTAPDRIHTFLPGITVLYTIAEFYNISRITTINYGVREGYLYYLLEQRGKIHGR